MFRTRRFLAAALVTPLIATALLVVGDAPPAAPAPTGFVTVSDGVQIAVNVRMPDNYVPGQKYPTLFEMSGYDGGSADGGTLLKDLGVDGLPFPIPGGSPVPIDDSRQLTDAYTGDYVTVHASVRGTGCSSGEFDLFSWRSALDGKEIIDGWIAQQPWSNGKVGIIGHSYGGITGFMVAATQPDHLRGASLSGLIDDMYRALVYPGGVTNYGFPLLWTGGIRPAYDIAGGLLPGLLRPEESDDDPNRQEDCALNILGKSRTVANEPLIHGLDDTDNEWYRSRSLITYADQIDVPIQMAGAYQDEQTGPRGAAHLFEKVGGVPKRLLLTNGDHNSQSTASYGLAEIQADRKAWLDHWVRKVDGGFGTLATDKSSVSVFLESHRDAADSLVANGQKNSTSFPLSDTTWKDWYLHANGTMNKVKPTVNEGGRPYVSGTGRQLWSYQAGGDVGPPITTANGPDELTYRSAPMAKDTAVIGPMAATLYLRSTGIDTELFVEIIDEAPDGSRSYLQRGVLRASHRATDNAASDKTPDGRIYRPYRPHTNPTPITPLATGQYLVEMWPLGHVFRAGHRIVIKVHAPPFVDSYYVYVPRSAPAVNTVVHGPQFPSRMMLPMVPLTDVTLGPAVPCGQLEAVRCIAP